MSKTVHDSRELTQPECLALLPTVPFGRLVFTEGALPAVIPVNFTLDPAGIVIRTAADSSVARVADGNIVAVQADDVDTTRRTGWSVTVVGQARTARDVVELGIVTGRRIGGPAVVPVQA